MVGPEDLVERLRLGTASEEDIQQLRDIGWLTPELEKLYRVDINRCLHQRVTYLDMNFEPVAFDAIPEFVKPMLKYAPIADIKLTVISDNAVLIQVDKEREV